MADEFHRLFPAEELAKNTSQPVEVEGHNILVCNANGEFYAIENQCTHQASKLEGGRIRNCFISCPLHGVRFDLRDGHPKGELTKVPVKTYPVRVEEGYLEVSVSE